MDSYLQDFVNEFEALGIAGTSSVWDDFSTTIYLTLKPLGVTQQLLDGILIATFCE
jgi:hypothetical protein